MMPIMTDVARTAEERAILLSTLNRPADAERTAREALSDAPEHPGLLCALASALLDQNRPAEALNSADAAAAADAGEHAHRLRAIALIQLGRAEEALAAANVAVELAPHGPNAADVRSWVLSRADRTEEGLAEARRLVGLAPHWPEAHTRLGDALRRFAARNGQHWGYLKADDAYREALRLDPENADARHELATNALSQGSAWRALGGLVDAGRTDHRAAPSLELMSTIMSSILIRQQVGLTIACMALPIFLADRGPAWAIRCAAAGILLLAAVVLHLRTRRLPPGSATVLATTFRAYPSLMVHVGVDLVLLTLLAATVITANPVIPLLAALFTLVANLLTLVVLIAIRVVRRWR